MKHGIAPERLGGDLLIEARLESADTHSMLVLTVRDSGSGTSDAALRRGREVGVGLRNIERRLAVRYGDRAELSIRSAPGGGTVAVLRLPAEKSELRDSVPARSAS